MLIYNQPKEAKENFKHSAGRRLARRFDNKKAKNLNSLSNPPMKKNLTAQQKKFCELYANGESASSAYKKTYSTKSKNPALIAYSANKLLNDEVIKKEIEEKREKNSSFLNYKAEDSFNKIKEIQEKALGKGDLTNALKAEEMAAKLAGLFKQNESFTVGAVGEFKEFYAAICAKKDYGNAKQGEKGQDSPKNEISGDSSKIIDA